MPLALLILLVLAYGCGQSKTTQSRFVVSLSALSAGEQFNGGGVLRIVNNSSGEHSDFEMLATNVVELPHGSWDMYFVGFQGIGPWQGPSLCGSVTGVLLNQEAQTVRITATSALCTEEPYVSMINSKKAIWDQSLWDQAQWGP